IRSAATCCDASPCRPLRRFADRNPHTPKSTAWSTVPNPSHCRKPGRRTRLANADPPDSGRMPPRPENAGQTPGATSDGHAFEEEFLAKAWTPSSSRTAITKITPEPRQIKIGASRPPENRSRQWRRVRPLAANRLPNLASPEPRGYAAPGIYPPNFDSIRDTVNSYMRQNWQSLGIAALSDFALDPRMGCDGCEYNTTYYSNLDHTHPTDAGYTIWGSYDLAAVNSLDGSSQRERTQGLGDGHLRIQASDDGQLWYSVFNGTNWATD